MADHGQVGVANGANGTVRPPAHDGSVEPKPIALPELYFRARCANPQCKALLGGFHIPCEGGTVVFACAHCERTTVFRNERFEVKRALAGPLNGAAACAPTSGRKRNGK